MLNTTDATTINEYEALSKIVRRTRPFRNSEKFINDIKNKAPNSNDFWMLFPFLKNVIDGGTGDKFNADCEFPNWCGFIFRNSDNFKRKILNCCFSFACNILPGDNLSILRTDIKPIKYFELRVISMLRNIHMDIYDFFNFISTIDPQI